MLKEVLFKVLPKSLYFRIEDRWRYHKIRKEFMEAYLYDLERYLTYSESRQQKSQENLIGLIVRRYHVIEKGLTMFQTRLGFGKQVLLDLIKDCEQYVQQFGNDDEQLIQAFAVIEEYKTFHERNNYILDSDLLFNIMKIESIKNENRVGITHSQKEYTVDEYFKYVSAPFSEFAKSRSSIRNYSKDKEVTIKNIEAALELAKTAPSACNRQSWRTYLFSNIDQIKEILEVQGGNRGFGHLTNKLIVITSETGGFSGVSERNQAFIDGGIYAMNLLYGLHFQKIAACILNCSNTIEKDIKLRQLCNIKDSEVFIALISCGYPPDSFKAAASIRYPLCKTNTIS